MCVIIAKKKGVEIPSREVLERCWNSNIDGAGFSVSNGSYKGAENNGGKENGKVLIQKGFMKFSDFYNALQKYGKDDIIVMHFRRTTQGGVDAGLTHPFPLDFGKVKEENAKRTRALSIETDIAVSHNGVIPMTCTPKYKREFPDNSDTEIFVRDFAVKLIECPEDLKDTAKMQMLSALIGPESKLALHTAEGIQIVGWFNEIDGVYFSNFSNAVHFDTFEEIN